MYLPRQNAHGLKACYSAGSVLGRWLDHEDTHLINASHGWMKNQEIRPSWRVELISSPAPCPSASWPPGGEQPISTICFCHYVLYCHGPKGKWASFFIKKNHFHFVRATRSHMIAAFASSSLITGSRVWENKLSPTYTLLPLSSFHTVSMGDLRKLELYHQGIYPSL